MTNIKLKNKVIELRKGGRTYGEIIKAVGKNIPKSTLSDWCSGILLSQLQNLRIDKRKETNIRRGRIMALAVNKKRREEYLRSVEKRVEHLPRLLTNKDVAKIVLATLYLGEGSKHRDGSLCLGNSDPEIIRLFLSLLRSTYNIDERKFRCTVQCRADQNTKTLERFWLSITKIPAKQFYKTRIDPRTIGQKSRKPEYKGVCKIDYFSADLYNELMTAGRLICSEN